MMGGGEVLRRATIWSLVTVYFVATIWSFLLLGVPFSLLGWTGYTVVGAVILTYRPGNNVGRVLLAIGLQWALVDAAFVAVELLGATAPSWLGLSLSVLGNTAGISAWVTLLLLVLIFPTGRVTTRVGRVLLASVIGLGLVSVAMSFTVPIPAADMWASPWLLMALGGQTPPDGVLVNLAVPILICAELIELSFRWRRSAGEERLQYLWFAFGCAIVVLLLIGDVLWAAFSPRTHEILAEVPSFAIIPMNAIPIVIGFAILRLGLFQIRRVISRALAYTIVTVTSAAVYAVVVASVTLLLPRASALPVAVATLAAAAVFLPVLRAVQRLIDRRFDRERYDAERTVDAFGEMLRAQVDPAQTTDRLISAIDRSLQPTSVGLWRREQD